MLRTILPTYLATSVNEPARSTSLIAKMKRSWCLKKGNVSRLPIDVKYLTDGRPSVTIAASMASLTFNGNSGGEDGMQSFFDGDEPLS